MIQGYPKDDRNDGGSLAGDVPGTPLQEYQSPLAWARYRRGRQKPGFHIRYLRRPGPCHSTRQHPLTQPQTGHNKGQQEVESRDVPSPVGDEYVYLDAIISWPSDTPEKKIEGEDAFVRGKCPLWQKPRCSKKPRITVVLTRWHAVR